MILDFILDILIVSLEVLFKFFWEYGFGGGGRECGHSCFRRQLALVGFGSQVQIHLLWVVVSVSVLFSEIFMRLFRSVSCVCPSESVTWCLSVP